MTASGSYAGDNTYNRAIAHGLGVTPKIVFIIASVGTYEYRLVSGIAAVNYWISGGGSQHAVTAMDATNFYVGRNINGSTPQAANANGYTYYWVALG